MWTDFALYSKYYNCISVLTYIIRIELLLLVITINEFGMCF